MQELLAGDVTPSAQPHLVRFVGAEAYCYTCDEDIPARRDYRCPREVRAEENRVYRQRAREARAWGTV